MRRGRGQRFAGVDLARVFRLREAAALGLRLVPPDPAPGTFLPRAFACDVRPRACGACTIGEKCPYGQKPSRHGAAT